MNKKRDRTDPVEAGAEVLAKVFGKRLHSREFYEGVVMDVMSAALSLPPSSEQIEAGLSAYEFAQDSYGAMGTVEQVYIAMVRPIAGTWHHEQPEEVSSIETAMLDGR